MCSQNDSFRAYATAPRDRESLEIKQERGEEPFALHINFTHSTLCSWSHFASVWAFADLKFLSKILHFNAHALHFSRRHYVWISRKLHCPTECNTQMERMIKPLQDQISKLPHWWFQCSWSVMIHDNLFELRIVCFQSLQLNCTSLCLQNTGMIKSISDTIERQFRMCISSSGSSLSRVVLDDNSTATYEQKAGALRIRSTYRDFWFHCSSAFRRQE